MRVAFVALILILQGLCCIVTFEWIARENIGAACSWLGEHPLYMLYTLFIVVWLIGLFDTLFFDIRWGFLICQLILAVFAVAESMKLGERKEYIEFSDLMIAGEWTETLSDVKYQGWDRLFSALTIALLVLIFTWCMKKYWKRPRRKKEMLRLCIGIPLSLLLFSGIVYMPAVKAGFPSRVVIGAEGEEKGGIVCFFESIAYYFMDADYSDKIYDEVIKEAEGDFVPATSETVKDIQVKPNIIVIMSEALWDINQLSEAVTFNKDPMEGFDSVETEGNYIKGKAASNVFGGGTDKSEFEFLTGWNSKYAVNGSSPYRDYFTKGQTSMVRYLKELGYLTYAIHPYKATFWGRDSAYANMGFDKFYSMTEMKHQDKYDVFISDDALTDEIIDRYKERRLVSDAPVFSFNVSIANHVTRIAEGEPGPVCNEVHVNYHMDYTDLKAYTRKKLTNYINGVYTSGKAWQRLISYFEGLDEPTVILLFGDHGPSFLSDFEGHVNKELSDEGFYETPFYVWNNYGLGDFGEDEVNISYLSELLLEYVGFPLTKQEALNRYLRLKLPVDTRFIVKDINGKDKDVHDSSYIDLNYGVYNAMYYYLKQDSYEADIWRIQP